MSAYIVLSLGGFLSLAGKVPIAGADAFQCCWTVDAGGRRVKGILVCGEQRLRRICEGATHGTDRRSDRVVPHSLGATFGTGHGGPVQTNRAEDEPNCHVQTQTLDIIRSSFAQIQPQPWPTFPVFPSSQCPLTLRDADSRPSPARAALLSRRPMLVLPYVLHRSSLQGVHLFIM